MDGRHNLGLAATCCRELREVLKIGTIFDRTIRPQVDNSLQCSYTHEVARAMLPDVQRLKAIVSRIVDRMSPIRVVLFGSWARGDVHADSDVDLCIVVDNAPDWFQRTLDFKREIEDATLLLEPHIYTATEYDEMRRRENPLIEQIEREGKVLYER